MPAALTLTRRQWAGRLNSQWAKLVKGTVENFVKIGDDLNEAKEQLEHGQWLKLLENDLKFSIRIAQMLMRISVWLDEKRSAASHLPRLLPPDYTTVYQITRLDDETFERLVGNGTINPRVRRNEISRILRQHRVRADEERVLRLVPRPGRYRTLVLDPAWEYDWLSIAGRAAPGYAMQTLDALRTLDVKQWAEPDCHLYCWTTNNFMTEACKLVAHWGFQHRTVLTWVKPPPFGLGHYFRNSTEHCLFATLGDTSTRPAAASIGTHFEWPRGAHSEKPEQFYELVRTASFPPYGEANQRQTRPDFASLFSDAPDFSEVAEREQGGLYNPTEAVQAAE